MKTFLCPRCTEVLTVVDGEDFVVCPRCGNTAFVSNFIEDIISLTDNETYNSKDEGASGLPE